MSIPYTLQDMKLLVVRMYQDLEGKRERLEQIALDAESLYRYIQSRIDAGVAINGEATLERKKRFKDWIRSRYNIEYYSVMFDKSLEEMPLIINDPDLGVLARWRLEIGK